MAFFLQIKNGGFVNVDHVLHIGTGITSVGDKEKGVVIVMEGRSFKLKSSKVFEVQDAVSEVFKQLKENK